MANINKIINDTFALRHLLGKILKSFSIIVETMMEPDEIISPVKINYKVTGLKSINLKHKIIILEAEEDC